MMQDEGRTKDEVASIGPYANYPTLLFVILIKVLHYFSDYGLCPETGLPGIAHTAGSDHRFSTILAVRFQINFWLS